MSHPSRPGFILTRRWRDTGHGTDLEFWLATPDGPKQVVISAQQPVAFAGESRRAEIEAVARRGMTVELRSLPLKTFAQEPAIGVYTRSHKQMVSLERRLRERGIALYEADVRPAERFMMERFITAAVNVEGGTAEGERILDPKLTPEAHYRPALRAVSLDIETSAHGDLYSVALEGCGQRQVYMLGEAAAGAEVPKDFDLEYLDEPAQIVHRLNAWFEAHDPDAIIGWNLIQFDLNLLQKHADTHRVPLLPGRGGTPIEWRAHGTREGFLFAPTAGRLVIDGIEALRAAQWSSPSFSLEHIAQTMLGEGKSIDDPYHRMAEIERRFREDKVALARYNLKDCELVTRIFAKAKLFEFLLERAHVTGLAADHFGGSIAAFSHHYLPRMHRAGYVAPNVGDVPDAAFPGGFVMNSRPGIYDSVLVLDYKSLYPSIIRSYLVDPVGLVEGLLDTSPSVAVPGFDGSYFSRTKHCLPAIVTQLWERRDQAKRLGNQPLSQALKLLMNSFVGVLGARDCRFFDPRLVSAVTLRGHEIMRRTRELVEAEGYEAIYGDTDSIFIWLKRRHSEAEAEAIAGTLVDKVNRWWREYLAATMGLESALEIEFDTHYRRFFMPTVRGSEEGSKKRYAGLVTGEDGSEEVIYRGLETVRTDWTPLAQTFQQALYLLVFKEQPYADYVKDYARRLMAGELDDLLVYRKRLRGKLGDYQRNTPPQVRAARVADEYNARRNRPLRYQNGGWISYVMTVNGPEPLEKLSSRIDYEHYLSSQLQPIADAILAPLNDSFSSLTSAQSSLFQA
ncbi:DNA polymerase II [Luteibacter yeojuensis]|uniref:DNA polymerase n=1 Tax=Luteibacter yeojuensis TaxID=345309 RepID=A0A7X5TPA3_9GAMM|nr:DNA polymerase II [Luteibacter yeojuensis]NID14583.1 DNA polymerase II [Luteibacter yeojuensis]